MTTSNNSQLLLFPCNYLLKVIGLATDEFVAIVLPIVNKHFANLTEGAITYKKSVGNKYMAITVNLYASNKQQMDALYKELTANPAVLMAL